MTPREAALRAMLVRAIHAEETDLLPFAELALAAGCRDAARTLYEGAFVRSGFSSRQRRDQAAIAARTGLWPDMTFATAVPDHATLPPVARAVADLAHLMAADALDRPIHAGSAGNRVRSLFAALGGDGRGLDRAIAAIAPMPLRSDDDIDRLARHLAMAGIAPLLRLATPPLGSPALLYAAARAEEGGLGPYLAGLATLIRDGRDAIGLIALAAGDPAPATVARWAPVLASRLPGHIVHDLIDRLADGGLTDAIRTILATRDAIDGAVWAVRDAALDAADFVTADAAQTRIAEANPGSAVEWIVLGEIRATAGRFAEARAAFARGLAIDPNHPGGAARQAAARDRDFNAYSVAGGFGTPMHRRRIRLARREGSAS